MKLLDRRTTNIEVQSQKKAQIDEGVAIAAKIDALRRTHDDLERQHNLFVEGMREQLALATKDLTEQCEVKKQELEILEEKRKALLAPLDNAWENVKIRERDIEHTHSLIEATKLSVEQEKKLLEERLTKAKESLGRIKIRENELKRVYDQAVIERSEAETLKNTIANQYQTQTKHFEEREKEIAIKEGKNEFDAQATKNYEEILKRKEVELNNRERMINDRYQTLLRTTNESNSKNK